nr:PAS domain-containing protein [Micromonospora sp. DSM 115978]
MIGRIVVDPREAVQAVDQPSRVWTAGEGSDEVTFIAAAQPTTGYTTVFQQRTETLQADLRSQHRQRALTVIAVVVGAVLSIAGFGLFREHGARRARARLHTLLSSAHDVIVVVGTDGVTTFVSPAVRHLLGHDPETLHERPLTDLAHPGDVARIERLLRGPAPRNTALNVRLRSSTGD